MHFRRRVIHLLETCEGGEVVPLEHQTVNGLCVVYVCVLCMVCILCIVYMHICMYVRMNVCMNVCMNVYFIGVCMCMYVCLLACIYRLLKISKTTCRWLSSVYVYFPYISTNAQTHG